MSYLEPLPSFKKIKTIAQRDKTIQILDTTNTLLEISFYTHLGWEIEVRYDITNKNFVRQPFTGIQKDLPKDQVRYTTDKNGNIHIHADDSEMILNQNTLQFRIVDKNDVVFESSENPFSSHQKPTEIYENLMSLKITDFTLRSPFSPKGHLFSTNMVRFQYPRPQGVVLGLPGQVGEYNRNGYRFELHNTDNPVHIPGKPMYQSWPILLHKDTTEKGWVGIFHDNPSRTFVDIGEFYEDTVTFESITGNTRIYIFLDKSIQQVSSKITKLLGPMPLPPLWAFGYQQARWSYMSTQELRNVIKNMKKNNIPFDALYCDIDYMDEYRVFTVNKKTFGDLPKFLKETKKDNINVICIVDPGVKIDEQYFVYQELLKGNKFLTKGKKGFVGLVWPGKVFYPDFGDLHTRYWWANLQNEFLQKYNFDGIWNDMNEPSNFDENGNTRNKDIFTSRSSFANEHNLYGYYMAKASKLGWEEYAKDTRGVIISRSGYPGIQQYAVSWHGDNHAWWEHLQLALNTTITYSLCGAFYTGPDIPGFTGNAPDDLAVRFFQLGTFLPLFRGHSIYFAKDKEPYVFGKKANEIIKQTIILRYSLLREWYSGFQKSIAEGKSPYIPMFTPNGQLITDQFLLFEKFLVAPIIQRDQLKRILYLPEGDWYALGNTKERIKGNTWITVDLDLTTLPVYIKAGSIVVRNTVDQNTHQTINGPEKFEIYEDRNGAAEGYWYNDDGISKNTVGTSKRLVYRNKKLTEINFTF